MTKRRLKTWITSINIKQVSHWLQRPTLFVKQRASERGKNKKTGKDIPGKCKEKKAGVAILKSHLVDLQEEIIHKELDLKTKPKTFYTMLKSLDLYSMRDFEG